MLLHRHLPHLTGDTRYFLPSLTDHILVRGDRMRTRHPSMMARTPTTTTTIPIKMKKLKEIEWGQGGQCLSSSTNWPPQVSSLFPFRECLSGQASDPPPPPSLHRWALEAPVTYRILDHLTRIPEVKKSSQRPGWGIDNLWALTYPSPRTNHQPLNHPFAYPTPKAPARCVRSYLTYGSMPTQGVETPTTVLESRRPVKIL